MIEQGLNCNVFKISQVDVTTSKAWCCNIEDSSQTSQLEDQFVKFPKENRVDVATSSRRRHDKMA